MKCVVCNRGEMVEEVRPRVVEREGRVAVVRNVPVLVCDACGEVYLDADVVKQLDVLFRQLLDGPVDHVVGHYDQAVA
jgi:YgiT-type zinc finger domain-containing protein